VRSFIEPDIFENTVPFDDTTPTSDQSALEIRVRLRVELFLAFFTENDENEYFIFREFHGR